MSETTEAERVQHLRRAATVTDDYEAPFGLPNHLSPSQINTMLTCGEQYRLERVVRVPSRPMWAGIGGSAVHKVTEILDREWFDERQRQAAAADE